MKKWELSRRTFLRGAGVTMALPVFEQMLPSMGRALAQGIPPARRIMAFYVPCGIVMNKWTPATTGTVICTGLSASS